MKMKSENSYRWLVLKLMSIAIIALATTISYGQNANPPQPLPPQSPPDQNQTILYKTTATQTTTSSPPIHVPVGPGKMYMVEGNITGQFKLKSFLMKFSQSRFFAKKSRRLYGSGWFLRVSGIVIGVAGGFLLSFGLNELIYSPSPASWGLPFTASGGAMLVGGIVFEIIGGILIPRGWTFLAEAIKRYNASHPDSPVLPAGS